ncbi:hypothetical protein Back2_00610 [Nocardioides baekrokdamisoli]|uniref:PRTase-CE domain-containing protein n=1 Tax=Nocardioides baekrokdamisoli TaxID=1804624 RepID=A0A3G9IX77_9ACTN|nr:hypothetical protein [Nocardioides baekrokdamisoli]BBH15774.1 hypothetical protein Back2_00610 [Nocardioides baekrokdamisoli]
MSKIYDDACERIRTLSAHVWENRVRKPDIDRWLDNFNGGSQISEEEHDHAIHLLSHFNHFGLQEIRVLLVALYRDLFRYPIVEEIRTSNGGTVESSLIEPAFAAQLRATRFIGMGNPSESGSHLLYYFRQVNKLEKSQFCHHRELFEGAPGPTATLASGVRRIVFIDDVLGSGEQASIYGRKMLPELKRAAANSGVDLELIYCVLFAKPDGLRVANGTLFDHVRAVHIVDDSELAFTPESRVYAACVPGLSRESGERMARWYGNSLFSPGPVGYGDGQMLLGLHHNVPDNTLPIIWSNTDGWFPIFERYAKEL